jgi:peptidoglycan/xylan/chitin deacetylase (PgdA/CDA1 family)
MARPFKRPVLRAHGKMFWAGLLRVSGLLYIARKWVQRSGAIVLTFHRVLTDWELHQTASLPGMIVRNNTFSRFLEYVSQACQFVDLTREPEWKPAGKLKVAITFDDGWSDNATQAYPIARQHHAPMAIFIVPEKTGRELPFWPERAVAALDSVASVDDATRADYINHVIEGLKKLPADERDRRVTELTAANSNANASIDKTMTWAEISELHAGGVAFGSHTSTHEILTVIPAAQAEKEISTSRVQIEEKLEAPCTLFSYPNGNCSDSVRDLVACSGYTLAFLNQDPGVWTEDCDPYQIPRINVCEYHLVDSRGNFSPLIFDYAVVWSAAKGLLAQWWKNRLHDKPQSSKRELQKCKSTTSQAV